MKIHTCHGRGKPPVVRHCRLHSGALHLLSQIAWLCGGFFLYLLLPIRAHKSTVMSRNNDQQVRHILKSIILLCASHLSLSSSHRLGFLARTGAATLARPLDRLIFNLVLSLVSETSTRFRLRHPQWGP